MHRERPFFSDLVTYMISGPVMVQVLEGEDAVAKNRDIMGATDPKKAAPGTIRADLADEHRAERRARLRQRRERCAAKSRSSSPRRRSARAEGGALLQQPMVQRMHMAPSAIERTNLLGLTRAELETFVVGLGEKPFRARQLIKWIYRRGVGDIDAMTDLGKDFAARLARERARSACRKSLPTQVSADGTRKWLLELESGQAIEMVFIPEPGRGTLCISSQVGCAMDCRFCSTGAAGVQPQPRAPRRSSARCGSPTASSATQPDGDRVDHQRRVHGHGRAARELSQRRARRRADDGRPRARPLAPPRHGQHLRPRAADAAASREETNVALAVSLHAPNDALRSELVPINRKHPIAELLDGLLALRRAAERPQRDVRVRDARRRQRPARARARARRRCCAGSRRRST